MTKWRRLYPYGTRIVPGAVPGTEETLCYKGLRIAPHYDPESSLTWPGWWEVVLDKTNEEIIQIYVKSDTAVLQIATQLAELAHWESFERMPRWSSPTVPNELREFIEANSSRLLWPEGPDPYCTLAELGIALPPDDGLSDIVPYPMSR